MPYFEARSYVGTSANRMHARSRPAAFHAKDFLNLQQIHNAIEAVMEACVAGSLALKPARKYFLKLAALRQNFMLPQAIYVEVKLSLKNATIRGLQGGDDAIYSVHHMNRDQLQIMYNSFNAPPFLQLAGEHTGMFPTELGFLAWLYLNGQGCKLQDVQKEFGMEYSRINRGIHAFETWMFTEHSFRCVSGLSYDCWFTFIHRVTDAWHYWAPHVAQFNAQILSRDDPPPGYEMLWAVGIDACVVCSAMHCQSYFVFLKL